jgi:hypothetical protein
MLHREDDGDHHPCCKNSDYAHAHRSHADSSFDVLALLCVLRYQPEASLSRKEEFRSEKIIFLTRSCLIATVHSPCDTFCLS